MFGFIKKLQSSEEFHFESVAWWQVQDDMWDVEFIELNENGMPKPDNSDIILKRLRAGELDFDGS